jgi:prevent-host-death family protein
MTAISVHDARAGLSRLIERALGGEDIVITRKGKPTVRLVPVRDEKPARRQLGQLAGEFECPPDSAFFDPLPDDVLAAFHGEDEDTDDPLTMADESKR